MIGSRVAATKRRRTSWVDGGMVRKKIPSTKFSKEVRMIYRINVISFKMYSEIGRLRVALSWSIGACCTELGGP